MKAAVLILAVISTMGGLLGGPPLGDHEALVAQCAREMRLSGDWLVPRFLDTTFVRKPPLGYWLVAAASYVLPTDAATGLPVTTTGARLPSALAGLGTVLLLWKLGSRMFGQRVGTLAAMLASASVFILLHAPNATVEMLVTFCCTWAGAHFWLAVSCSRRRRRLFHLLLFYVAMGVGMLAKGPVPLAMLGVPLACWWYLERPQRLWATGGPGAATAGLIVFLRGLGRRTILAFTRLWVFPGILIFLAVFVPWMAAVARDQPHAWRMWNWQYLQRFQGDYEDTRVRGLLYYVPIILGLTIPWTLALGHALAAPWMSRFRDQRRPLFFLGVWSVVGAAVMSVMGFKKPYYVLPAIPPLILLIAPIVDAFAQRPPSVVGRPRRGLVLLAAIAAVAPFVAYPILRQQMPSMATRMELPLVVLTIGVLAAVFEHGRRRPTRAVYAAAATMTAVFLSAWYAVAPSFSNFERVRTLHRQLLAAGVPEGAKLYWADQRPDARLWFYYHRRSAHLVDPADIVMQTVVRKRNDLMLQSAAIARAGALLGGPDPVYLILDREHLTLLEQIEADARARVRELTTVDVDGHPDADDWVVISNAAGPTG